MATKTDIKEYRKQAIIDMVNDILESESNGVPIEEIWDNMRLDNYSYFATEEDKIKAFKKAGYTVEFE